MNSNLILKWRENFGDVNETSKKEKNTVIKIYNLEQSNQEIINLDKSGAAFEVSKTTNSCKIKVFKRGGNTVTYWYLERTMTEQFLILLNKLKKEIKERMDHVIKCPYSKFPGDTKYYFFNKVLKELHADSGSVYDIENVYEADISHAYYRAAYVLGFISKNLYVEIVRRCSKGDRLRLLGCIATVKTWEKHDKGQFLDGDIIKDETLRDAWFKICNYVDQALLELKEKLGDNFLFYWVDGIYFKSTEVVTVLENANFFKMIKSVKYKYDLDFKIIPLVKFEVINRDDHVEVKVHKASGRPKRFFPDKQNIKSYSIIGLNE